MLQAMAYNLKRLPKPYVDRLVSGLSQEKMRLLSRLSALDWSLSGLLAKKLQKYHLVIGQKSRFHRAYSGNYEFCKDLSLSAISLKNCLARCLTLKINRDNIRTITGILFSTAQGPRVAPCIIMLSTVMIGQFPGSSLKSKKKMFLFPV